MIKKLDKILSKNFNCFTYNLRHKIDYNLIIKKDFLDDVVIYPDCDLLSEFSNEYMDLPTSIIFKKVRIRIEPGCSIRVATVKRNYIYLNGLLLNKAYGFIECKN